MNEKTAKLLNKYASQTNQDPKKVKDWWKNLNQHERAKERIRIKAEMAR